MLSRLSKAIPEQTRRGGRILSICLFAFRSLPAVLRMALPFIFLCLVAMTVSTFVVPEFGLLGYALYVVAFWSALLGGFWIQWSAGALVSTDCEFNSRWLFLPPRGWLEKTAPVAFVLAVGYALLQPFGTAIIGASTFGMVVLPLLVMTLCMLALSTATGISSVAAAQEIDADTSGHTRTGGLLFQTNFLICMISFLAIALLLGPVLFLLAILVGLPEGWTTPLLVTVLVVITWAATSAAAAFLLEDRIWHTDFYN